MSEAPEYLVARVREALAQDPRVAELHVDVAVTGAGIVLSGEVPTPERQEAISAILRERFPDHEHRNHTTVETVSAPERPEEIR